MDENIETPIEETLKKFNVLIRGYFAVQITSPNAEFAKGAVYGGIKEQLKNFNIEEVLSSEATE